MKAKKTTLACSLNDTYHIEFRHTSIRELRTAAQEIRELPDGYALRLPGERSWFEKLAGFIAYERDCCRFLTFELVFEPDGGPIWLHIRGPEGVKEFIQSEVSASVNP